MKWITLFLLLVTPLHAQIYADFQTTAGNFTVELHYDKTPKTVANFIGLAEGSRPWLDAQGNVQSTPFYNGITFHRVIDGFMNQFGSPNGLGSDGPGYTFADEFEATLNHDIGYTLSMANSGPHTNGSQLFITVSPQSHLNNVHTVFGLVPDDGHSRETINAINTAPKDPNNSQKLQTPVSITSISIRREGSDAENFDIHAQDLPMVGTRACTLDSSLKLSMQTSAGDVVRLYEGNGLLQFSNVTTRYYAAYPFYSDENNSLDGVVDLSVPAGTNDKYFFRTPVISYQDSPPYMPTGFIGRTLTINTSNATLTCTYTTDTGGTLVYSDGINPPVNALFECVWREMTPHMGRIYIYTSLVNGSGHYYRYRLNMGIDSHTSSEFSGRHTGTQERFVPNTGSYVFSNEQSTFTLSR